MAYGDDDDGDADVEQQNIDQPSYGDDNTPQTYQPSPQPSDNDWLSVYPPVRQQAPSNDWLSAYPPVSGQQPQLPQQPSDERPDESELGAGLRSFAHSVLPTVAGAVAGTALGTAFAGPFGTIPGFLAGAGGMLATGYAAGKAQEATLSAIGMDDSHTLALNAQKYPWSTAIGGALPAALAFQPGTAATTLAQRAGQAGLVGALDVGTQYALTGEVDPRSAAVSAATGFLLPGTQPWVERAAGRISTAATPAVRAALGAGKVPPSDSAAAAAQTAVEPAPAGRPDQKVTANVEPLTPEQIASPSATSDSKGNAQAKPPPQGVDTDAGQAAQPAQPGATGKGEGLPSEAQVPAGKPYVDMATMAPDKQAALRTALGPEVQPAPEVPAAAPAVSDALEMQQRAGIAPPESQAPVERAAAPAPVPAESPAAGAAPVAPAEPVFKPKTGQEAYDEGFAHAQRGIGRRKGVYDQNNYDRGYFAGREPAATPAAQEKPAAPKASPIDHEGDLLRTLGKPEFDDVFNRLKNDKSVDQAQMREIANRFYPPVAPKAPRNVALAAIRSRQHKLMDFQNEGLTRKPLGPQRGPRAIRTEPLPIGKEQAILEAGVRRVEEGVPPGTPVPPERQAMARQAAGPIGGGSATPPPPPAGPVAPLREFHKALTPEEQKRALDVAGKIDDELHKLTTVPAADAISYLKSAEAAIKIHPELMGKGGEQVYKAIERGTVDQLPKNLMKGYDAATGKFLEEANAIRDEMVKRKEIEAEPDDPNYVHRILRNKPNPDVIGDPLNSGKLPGMREPSSTKDLGFAGAHAEDGSRLVISPGNKNNTTIWNNGQHEFIPNPKGESLKTGDKFTYNGKEYTVDRGISDEIEQHAKMRDSATGEPGDPPRYFQNALLSAFDFHRQMKMMKDFSDWKAKFLSPESPAAEFMTRDRDVATAKGFVKSDVPEFSDIWMHPDLAQTLHNNYNPGLGLTNMNWLRAINQFAVRSIFWNPVPHSMNALTHYLVARGWDWLNPQAYGRWGRSLLKGFEAAYTQNDLLQEMNRAGASLVMSKIDSQRLGSNLGKVLNADLKRDPGKWEQFARQWRLGHGIDAVNLIYDKAQQALWTFSDGLMASRISELEEAGMSRDAAIADARKHMPDYRLPLRFMGSRQFVNVMADPTVMMFGRYHMGMLNSLGDMLNAMHPLSNVSREERISALGNAFALGVLGLMVKPLLDQAAQYISGNKNARLNPRGPGAPISHVMAMGRGEEDIGRTVSGIISLSPALDMAAYALRRDIDFANRRIIEPAASPIRQVGQAAQYAAQSLVSPYGTFGPTLMPGSKGPTPLTELMSQVLDVKLPTAAQVAGQKKGITALKSEAKARAKRPRGPIEYWVNQLSR